MSVPPDIRVVEITEDCKAASKAEMSQEEALEFCREQMEELLGRATEAITMSQETEGVMEAAVESMLCRVYVLS